jgi:hypothetical protein
MASVIEHEVRITLRFKAALKQAKNLRQLPVRIEREPAEDDPASGLELGRIDLKLNPAASALEEVYFAKAATADHLLFYEVVVIHRSA